MKILLTGAGGQLATDLHRLLRPQHEVVALTHAQLDIGEPSAAARVLDEAQPQMVINTAAYHRVDDCETEVERSFRINATAVLQLARWCAAHEAVFVHFSTDYVFSGREPAPRCEGDVAEPVSVYGASKLAGEHLARQACARHFVIRTCGLYGDAGSPSKGGNFVDKMLSLAAAGKPIQVVADQVLAPSYTADVAAKVVQLLGTNAYGLYHVTNAGSCSWYEFTRTIFTLSGVAADLSPTTAARFAARAQRPAYSVLGHDGLARLGVDDLPSWEDALRRYLDGRTAARR